MSTPPNVVATGKATYKIQVPYKLIRVGSGNNVPLVIWLHGFGQTYSWMMQQFEPVWQEMEAHHLFIQAPYLLLERYINKQSEGYSWYMFNGEREHYEDSMEHAAEFILDLAGKMRAVTNHKEVYVVGFSQGGYLSGYLALSRPKIIKRAYMLGGRFKHEWVTDWDKLTSTKLIAIHGTSDTEVLPGPQREAIDIARQHNVSASFIEIPGGHSVTVEMLQVLKAELAK
jgi:predicted esterase